MKENMDINITQDPPTDVLQIRRKYLRIIPSLLILMFCAILLAAFQIVVGSGHDVLLENIAIVLFVGPALAFFYFVEQLHEYRALSAEQEQEIEGFCRQDHDVAAYCAKVSMMGRKLVKAEYDACKLQIKDRSA